MHAGPRLLRVAVMALQLLPALFTALPQGAFLCVQVGRAPHFEVAGSSNLSEIDAPGHRDEDCPEPPPGTGHCSDIRLNHGSAITAGGHVICPTPATSPALPAAQSALDSWTIMAAYGVCQSPEAGPGLPPLGHSLPLRI